MTILFKIHQRSNFVRDCITTEIKLREALIQIVVDIRFRHYEEKIV